MTDNEQPTTPDNPVQPPENAASGPAESERTTAVGVFEDRRHAHLAVDELCRNGFSLEQIGFVIPEGRELGDPPKLDHRTRAGERARAGAAAGGAIGGLVGAALATAVIPGVGPFIAGGLLVGAAIAGVAGGGLVGSLVGLSIPEEEAKGFEKEFHEGRTLVTVKAG